MRSLNFIPSDKFITDAANSLDNGAGQCLYNLILNYPDYYDAHHFIFQFGIERRLYELDTPEFRQLFKEYDEFRNIKVPLWERNLTDYIDLIVLVGKKWVQINLPDEIDLCFDEELIIEISG